MSQDYTSHVPSREQEIAELITSASELAVVERALEEMIETPDPDVIAGAAHALMRIRGEIVGRANALARRLPVAE